MVPALVEFIIWWKRQMIKERNNYFKIMTLTNVAKDQPVEPLGTQGKHP